MLSIVLSVLKFCGLDVLPKVIEAYNKKADTLVENNKTTAEVAIAMIQADAQVQAQKAQLLGHKDWVTTLMVVLLGLPVAIHWAAICLDSTFKFSWKVPAVPGLYGEAEIEIIKSFFYTGVAYKAVTSVASIIKR